MAMKQEDGISRLLRNSCGCGWVVGNHIVEGLRLTR